MPDYTRDKQFALPVATDPNTAVGGGLDRVTAWMDSLDSKLNTVNGQAAGTERFLGVWYSNGTSPALASSGTATDSALVWESKINVAGTGTPTVTLSTGAIVFNTDGFYRFTHAIMFIGGSGFVEGSCQAALKLQGGGNPFINRTSIMLPMNNFNGVTMTPKTSVIRAAASGGDVVTGSTYRIGVAQTNSSSGALNYGGSTNRSWFAIEYMRPLT